MARKHVRDKDLQHIAEPLRPLAVRVDTLSLDPRNARLHGDRNLQSIKDSLARFGQQKPLVVRAGGVVVAGNGTLEVARELGWTWIAAAETGLDAGQSKAYAIADNRTAELAEWDDGALGRQLAELRDADFPIGELAWGDDDIEDMLAALDEGWTEDAEPAPVPVVPVDLPGLHVGDALEVLRTLPADSVHCCVTSPPYWGLRDYGHDGQIGLEETPEAYTARLVEVFREVRRVLRDDGTLWLNLGSSYCGDGSKTEVMFNAGASGGTRPNQSRPQQHDPACGNGDTELPGSPDADRACRGSRGEHPDANPNRHGRSAHSGQCAGQDERQTSQIGRGNGRSGYAQASPGASLPGAPASNRSSSSCCAPVASGLGDAVSVCLQGLQTSSGDAPPCAGTAACISCTAGTLRPSSHHKSGSSLSGVACGDPSCSGRCGICWAYSSIPSLGFKVKDLAMIPQLVAFALQADGWYLRSDIIWHKPNPMPEPVTDRCTKAHEYMFMLAKSEQYYWDAEAVREESVGTWNPHKGFGTPRKKAVGMTERQLSMQRTQFAYNTHHDDEEKTGRNRRSVWTIPTRPYPGAHFATFPPDLVKPCILAGCPEGGVVLDPFFGSGTTGKVADELGRHWVGIELNPAYATLIQERVDGGGEVLGCAEEETT